MKCLVEFPMLYSYNHSDPVRLAKILSEQFPLKDKDDTCESKTHSRPSVRPVSDTA